VELDIDVNDSAKFVPKSNGNADSEKPIVFNHRYLTVAEQSEIEYWTTTIRANKLQLKHNVNDIFLKLVTSIENFTVRGKPITKPVEWLALNGKGVPGWLKEMVEEFNLYIENGKEPDIKN
jgi:hypothetical protein